MRTIRFAEIVAIIRSAMHRRVARMPIPPPLNGIIRYESLELICLHEAGHAAIGITLGARVTEMELYLTPAPGHGRTQVRRTDAQSKTIALGGFAVERRLWEDNRLMLPNGVKPTEKEMIGRSLTNANKDQIAYFGQDFRQADGSWPEEMDLEFMECAQAWGRRIDVSLVERIAGALLVEAQLDEARIEEIVRA